MEIIYSKGSASFSRVGVSLHVLNIPGGLDGTCAHPPNSGPTLGHVICHRTA
jgi:hypothetical protein